MSTINGQDNVLSAAQRIVQSLANTDDILLILSSFDNRLSFLSSFGNPDDRTSYNVNHWYEAADLIIRKGADSKSEISFDYLNAVDEIIQLTEELNLNPADLTDRAWNTLHLAMSFGHVLIQNAIPLDPDRLNRYSISASAAAVSIAGTEFFNNNDNRGVSSGGDDMWLELIDPEAVINLREIADRMIKSGYEMECHQVYCNVRRNALDECMVILGVDKLSIEEVQKIEWRSLDDKIKKWIQAVNVVVRGLLSSEKQLCKQIFAGSDLINEGCFLQASKGCVMQLSNFGEAVAAIGKSKRSAQKLFRILDMYDALAVVLPDLQNLFVGNNDIVCSEVKGVLDLLGEAAIGTFLEFEKAPLARYVMNHVELLEDYSDDAIISLLGNVKEVESRSPERQSTDNSEVERMPLRAKRLLALLTSSESNIEDKKSRMYEDNAMQYIFVMINILYIVQKLNDSNLLGDNQIRERRGLIRQHATRYLRALWTKVLFCLNR